MAKGLKQILAAGIVVAVFVVGIIIITVFLPEKDNSAEPTAVPTKAPEVYYLISEDGEAVRQVENIYSDGSSFIIEYLRDEDGKLSYNTIPESKYFSYNGSKFRSMMYTLTSLNAVSKVEENPKDLSVYGLDKPQFTMILTLEDKEITLSIGNPTPVDNNFYVMTDAENAVYTMGNYLSNLIMRSELEYRDIASFPTYTEDDIFLNIDHVELTKRDGTRIEIMLDSELNHPGNVASSAYVMLSPTLSSCNDENVQQSVLEVVAKIAFGGIVKDIPASEIAEYGFDNPARLRLYDTSDNKIDIYIGSYYGQNDAYILAATADQYEACINEGIDLTLLAYSSEAFEWLNISYMSLLNRSVWIQDIHSVEAIEYEMDGRNYYLELFEYDDVTGSGVDVVRTEGILNGKNISETNTKRLYSRTLNLRQVSLIPEDADLSNPQYRITLHLKDGTKRVLELARLNERQYACIVDGIAEHYIYTSNLQNLMYAFDRLDDDRDVPLVYYT